MEKSSAHSDETGAPPNLGRRSFLSHSRKIALGAAFGSLAVPPAAMAANVRTVIIDAGHGGHDVGANEGLVFEKHLNLDVSLRLQIQLKRRGYRTILTRNRDEFIPLLNRAKQGNRHRNAIFVSIHFNSAWRSSALGIETFYYSYAGYQLASKIHTSVIRKMKAENRGVKRARFSVLRNSKIPAVLVEGGFLSNSSERHRILQPWYRQALAESVAAGIADYASAG